MTYSLRLIVLAAALVITGTIGLRAEPGQEIEPSDALSLLLPHEKGKALCYVGTGDPITFPLEDIPKRDTQRSITINHFLFEVTSQQFDADDSVKPPKPGEFYYSYRMVAQVVGMKVPLISAGQCGSGSPDVFGCGSDCDGGTMAFRPIAGSDALFMGVSSTSRRFRMSWGCGGGGAEGGKVEVLQYDPATRNIRMERADAKMCAPIVRAFRKRKD